MPEEKKKKRLYKRLISKYRLVVMNDDTFEEKASLRLSPLNVFVFTGTVFLTLITFFIYVIAFTPLKEYIPGYADLNTQRNVILLSLKADSLEQEVAYKDKYIRNIKNIIEGKTEDDTTDLNKNTSAKYDTMSSLPRSIEDSVLRAEIEFQDKYELNRRSPGQHESTGISNFFFFTPMKGTITNTFNPSNKHFGVDIVSSRNEAIKSTLDGTIIIAGFTSETGYIIGVQHNNNILSLYKHNSALLKKTGDHVKAGDPIAIIGNTGELSSGPHLHFELWYNGSPVNPRDYIVF